MARILRQRTLYADGQVVHGGDLTADLVNLQAQLSQFVTDSLGGWSTVVTGFTITASGGMTLQLAAGVAYDQNGVGIFSTTTLSVTVSPNSSGAARTDVIWVQDVANTSGTNASYGGSGLPNTVNTIVAGITAGTPGKVSLGDPTKVQVGSIVVQNGATDLTQAAQATINNGDYAPNSQGPLASGSSLLAHVAASLLTTTVHGAQATSSGGHETARLAQTDASYGAVGRAFAVMDTGNTARQLSPPGTNTASTIACYDASGRVQDAENLGGVAPSGYATAAGLAAANSSIAANGTAISNIESGAQLVGHASNADQLAGQAPAHYATASSNDGIADNAKKVHGVLVDAFWDSSSSLLSQSGHVDKVFVFTQPFTRDPAVYGTCRSTNSNGTQMEVGRPISVSNTQVTVRFTNGDGNTQTLSNFAIAAIGT